MKKEIVIAFLVISIFLIPSVSASIVISEVMYDHDVHDNYRYIELYNDGASSVDLTDWKTQIKSGSTWRAFGDITISAGEYIIIVHKLTGANSYELHYGDGDGVWDSNDASYNAVDSNSLALDTGNDKTTSIKDGAGTIQSTFDYGPTYGAAGDGNSLHKLGDDSIAAGTPTQGAASGISYCGDGTCDAGEDCASCSADCLGAGQVCCSAVAYTGDCCVDGDCGLDEVCTNNVCTSTSYCGDGTCDANESCSNCTADCACSAAQCCSAASENCDATGCVNSTYITTTGNICCDGTENSGECCTDAECASPNVCEGNQCVDPYSEDCTAESCLCDLIINLLSESSFTSSTSQNYYIHINDLLGNYTGSSTITYWIEDTSASYITSYSPANITMSIDENKTMSYSPSQTCSDETQYIKAKITNFGCNDSNTNNDEASKTITINKETCTTTTTDDTTDETSTETTEEETPEILYNIEVPQTIEISEGETEGPIEKSLMLKVNIDNNKDDNQEFEVWSYVYLEDECYSCADENWESNKRTFLVGSGSSKTIDLENIFNVPEEGSYKVKVKILEVGTDAAEEFDYDIQVGGVIETITGESTKGTEDVYETKSKKIRTISIIVFMALLIGTAIFFGIQNKEQIIEFIREKKSEFERKKSWKEHIEKRRGKGILQRLSKGFLKKEEDGKGKS